MFLVLFQVLGESEVVTSPTRTSLCLEVLSTHHDATNRTATATERALYVKSVLSHRLQYMQTGKRTRDFAEWVHQRKGQVAVFALNEPEEDNENLKENEDFHPRKQELVASRKQERRKDPFPPDRMNLDLFATEKSPVSCYRGKIKQSSILEPPRNWQLVCRAIQLGMNFCPVISTAGLAVISKRFREGTWYPWLANCIGGSGAAWIKWGQWSSTRNDMFPEALCDQLARLHNDAPAHSWTFSQDQLEESLGLAQGTLDQVFDEFDENPLASGSIAQVHRAVLDGQRVAIKIRHPNVAQLIDMDFRIMTAAARVFDYIPAFSWLHIRESVEQFSHTMAAQSFLNVEGHHLEVLNHNFRKWPHVRFPQPVYASASCIIESFERGNIVTSIIEKYNGLADYYNLGAGMGYVDVEEPGGDDIIEGAEEESDDESSVWSGYDLLPVKMARFVVSTGLAVYLKMLLVDNLMHADLHPGNIMLDMNGDVSAHPAVSVKADGNRVTLVDAGMVAQLTDDESAVFIGLLASLGEGNGREAAGFALQFSLENSISEEERQGFIQDMDDLFVERCRGYGTDVDVGHVLRGVLGLIRKHRVRIDANFATLVVNILCLESLARQVCPSYNLLDFARPLLQSYRQMCYEKDGTPKPEARSSRWVMFRLSLMYLRKSAAEATFFRRWSKEKQKTALIGQHLIL